jgi:hypothetical protein
MVGDPALDIISEAYVKGVRRFDVDKAYAYCRDLALGTAAWSPTRTSRAGTCRTTCPDP